MDVMAEDAMVWVLCQALDIVALMSAILNGKSNGYLFSDSEGGGKREGDRWERIDVLEYLCIDVRMAERYVRSACEMKSRVQRCREREQGHHLQVYARVRTFKAAVGIVVVGMEKNVVVYAQTVALVTWLSAGVVPPMARSPDAPLWSILTLRKRELDVEDRPLAPQATMRAVVLEACICNAG